MAILSKVRALHTDKQTDATENITIPYSRVITTNEKAKQMERITRYLRYSKRYHSLL